MFHFSNPTQIVQLFRLNTPVQYRIFYGLIGTKPSAKVKIEFVRGTDRKVKISAGGLL